jgi:GMP synthase (glutamine-hydrolysing) B subunit
VPWPGSPTRRRSARSSGEDFIEVFDEEAHKITGVQFLAQGTIYPDVIESAGGSTGKAHVIKSHHNVGGLPEHMRLKLIEPLRELFKDEVRALGVELGLPRDNGLSPSLSRSGARGARVRRGAQGVSRAAPPR